jgi:glycosyltransferase involved in cell wall biosynthesis
VALECFGIIVLEAFAFGMPVLGTDVGSLPELLRPISPELMVPGSDVEALRHKIECFVIGRLALPRPEELSGYLARNYSHDAVVPRIAAMLED